MKIKGTKTEYNVEIDIGFKDVIKLLKQKALDREWDKKVNEYYIKDDKIMNCEPAYHNSFDYDIITEDKDQVEKFKLILQLEELFKNK